MSEKIAKSIMFQILRALEYLNSLEERIIHYDLKPSNILFNNGEIKITDFGLSKLMPENSSHHVELTSPGYGSYWYLPPECFRLESGKSTPTISPKVDVWSFGIIFYQLLFGKRPFGDSMFPSKELIDTIVHSNQVEFPNKPVISDAAKNLISDCLSKNESSRPCVKDLLDHPYFTESSLQPTLPKSSKK